MYTAVQIPCCLCGTQIWPNAANKCSACLASQIDIASLIQRGPASTGGEIIVHQCRQCRRYQRYSEHGGNHSNSYQDMEPESPELLALCLKHIPALSSSSNQNSMTVSQQQQHNLGAAAALSSSTSSVDAAAAAIAGKLQVMDAHWIWTEPHSMRFKVHLTIRYSIENVPIQQRVSVELKNQWKQCADCNREFTNRTWHALVQVRQTGPAPSSLSSASASSGMVAGGSRKGGKTSSVTAAAATRRNRKGLAALEMALAKQATIRKHVLKIDASRNGFDFYFLQLAQAQAFASYIQRLYPTKAIKSSQKLVSTNVKNNTANVRHTLTCELVPLCRDDLILITKQAVGSGGGGGSSTGGLQKLAGRFALITKVSSVFTLMDAAPTFLSKRGGITAEKAIQDCQMDLSAEQYYRNEKLVQWLQSSDRLTRFVVLDVELVFPTTSNNNNNEQPSTTPLLYQGPPSGISQYALAEVVVARESEFGVERRRKKQSASRQRRRRNGKNENDSDNDNSDDDDDDDDDDDENGMMTGGQETGFYTVVTHLGHLLQAGDIVLGYDIERTLQGQWDDSNNHGASSSSLFQNHYNIPDIVLVKKAPSSSSSSTTTNRNKNNRKNAESPQQHTVPSTIPEEDDENDDDEEGGGGVDEDIPRRKKKGKPMTKKREKRRRRQEGKKMRALEESAARMGFLDNDDLADNTPSRRSRSKPSGKDYNDNDDDEDDDDNSMATVTTNQLGAAGGGGEFDEELWDDPEMAAELHQLETALEHAAALPNNNNNNNHDNSAVQQQQQQQEEDPNDANSTPPHKQEESFNNSTTAASLATTPSTILPTAATTNTSTDESSPHEEQ